MKKIHKQNYIIVIVAMLLLSFTTILAFGMTKVSARGILIMMCGAAISSIGYFIVKDDFMKALCITIAPSLATLAYSAVLGGNSVAFLANFVLLAMMAVYFDQKYVLFYSIPIGGIGLICAIWFPWILDGETYTLAGALTKDVFFCLIAAVLVNATKRGRSLLVQAEENIKTVKENENIAIDIATNLNHAIKECQDGVIALTEQADTVDKAAEQMGSVVENTSNATVEVNEKVLSANQEIDRNFELSKKLEISFGDVDQAVNNGNIEAENVKENLQAMSETVYSAQEATNGLLEEMRKITDILSEINSIASQTNLLSLNASIEAARAGEHGKGFAVVADEIRSLSEDSAKAAKNIQNILGGLTTSTTDVSNKINAGAQAALDGVQKMEDLLNVFETINNTTQDAHQVITEEYQIIESVKKDFEIIHSEVETLVATTEENSAMIMNISDSISKQNDHVRGVQNEMHNIQNLSVHLEQHFS